MCVFVCECIYECLRNTAAYITEGWRFSMGLTLSAVFWSELLLDVVTDAKEAGGKYRSRLRLVFGGRNKRNMACLKTSWETVAAFTVRLSQPDIDISYQPINSQKTIIGFKRTSSKISDWNILKREVLSAAALYKKVSAVHPPTQQGATLPLLATILWVISRYAAISNIPHYNISHGSVYYL